MLKRSEKRVTIDYNNEELERFAQEYQKYLDSNKDPVPLSKHKWAKAILHGSLPNPFVSNAPSAVSSNIGLNCLWGWADGNGNLECPIRKEEPTAKWDRVIKACNRCPRYLKVIGTKKLIVEKQDARQITPPPTQTHTNTGYTSYNKPSPTANNLTQAQWDQAYWILLEDDYGLIKCHAGDMEGKHCDFGTKDMGEARKHCYDKHHATLQKAIDEVVKK